MAIGDKQKKRAERMKKREPKDLKNKPATSKKVVGDKLGDFIKDLTAYTPAHRDAHIHFLQVNRKRYKEQTGEDPDEEDWSKYI